MSGVTGSLDTNVLARLLLKDDLAQHAQAERLIEGAGKQLAVADTAFIELAFILEKHYELVRSDVCKGIESLLGLPVLSCNRLLIREVLPLFVAYRTLSFEDCYLAMCAKLNNAEPLWTFDQKLAKRAPTAKLLA